jgi:hypothetical protein
VSVATLILGSSGSGKSTALRNLNPKDVALIQAIRKPLPFKTDWKPYVTDQSEKIIAAMKKTDRKIIVIDDYQYTMANEFMRRSDERGYDKFTEIGRHAWDILTAATALADDVRVYILSHTQEDDSGHVKMKTIGKMLDEKITLEGMVTIVLRTSVTDGLYQFSTRNNGSDSVKTPMGLFDSEKIDNDLALVDAAIVDYYGLSNPLKEAA